MRDSFNPKDVLRTELMPCLSTVRTYSSHMCRNFDAQTIVRSCRSPSRLKHLLHRHSLKFFDVKNSYLNILSKRYSKYKIHSKGNHLEEKISGGEPLSESGRYSNELFSPVRDIGRLIHTFIRGKIP